MTTTATPTPSAMTPESRTSASTEGVLGILALVFGIASIGMGFHPVFAITGVILGLISLRRESSARGFAIGGIVTSAVTLGGWLFGALVATALIPFFAVAALWS